jgi:hypothetical protein
MERKTTTARRSLGESCLLRAGVAPEQAAALGRDAAVDLHALLALIDRGCPPHLAIRIVAPLDREPSA